MGQPPCVLFLSARSSQGGMPAVLPPAGEAPAKRVLRENLGSLPAVRNVVFSSEYAEEHTPTPGKAHSIARRSIPAGPDTLLVFAYLLSLRTSDRRHWCGNPSAPLASLSEGGGIRRSPARRMTEGLSRPSSCHGFA